MVRQAQELKLAFVSPGGFVGLGQLITAAGLETRELKGYVLPFLDAAPPPRPAQNGPSFEEQQRYHGILSIYTSTAYST